MIRKYTVKELIEELEKIPQEKIVEVCVSYDNCDHLQYLSEIYTYDCLDWVVLKGGVE